MRATFIKLFLLVSAGWCITLSGCGFYSQSGASVPPDAKTFSVDYIQNLASIVQPTLSQVLTEKLKRKFINETQLKLAQSNGDVRFSGKIIEYRTAPVGVQGNQQNAVNQLTIVVEIDFENTKDEKQNFKQSFSTFVNYPADQNLATVENQLVQTATDQLVTDIFNKAFINW
jgi:outer membrane lipopolysaccharide assembly protein LptE/RlpB